MSQKKPKLGEQYKEHPWAPNEIFNAERQLDPYPFFKQLRDDGSIRWDDDRGTYDVSRYDEVVEILMDTGERFTRRETSYIEGQLLSREGDIHTELRGMAEGYFKPGYLEKIRPFIEGQAELLIDSALEGDNQINFVEEIAEPLPILVVSAMMGVPKEKRDNFRKWTLTMGQAPSPAENVTKDELQRRQQNALDNLTEFFEKELQRREDNPERDRLTGSMDDMLTNFLTYERESDLIDRSNLLANASMILIAGNSTTTHFMNNAMWTFIEEDIISDLKDGSIPLTDALDEVLRYRSPVMGAKRITTEDTEIAGMEISEGERVVGWLSSANRDERVFEDPDTFKVNRNSRKKPIPYGKGIHYCLGAPLANMEAEIVFTELLDRIKDASIATDDLQPIFSEDWYGTNELPITVST